VTERDERSQAELRRLVEAAVNAVSDPAARGLWFCVDAVEASGHPPQKLKAWATLHFLPDGSPFCCGEPGCHVDLGEDRLAAIGDHVRRAMGVRLEVAVEFAPLAVHYEAGVEAMEGGRHLLRTHEDTTP